MCVGELVGCEDCEFDEGKAWPLYRRSARFPPDTSDHTWTARTTIIDQTSVR